LHFLDTLSETILRELSRRAESKEPIGVPTGIGMIDETLGGLARQTLSYLVGDSGVGKSWLVTAILLHAAGWLQQQGKGPASAYVVGTTDNASYRRRVQSKTNKRSIVVFWSLEMAEAMVVTRMLVQLTKQVTGVSLDSGKLLRGQHVEELDALVQGYQRMKIIGQHIAVVFRDQTVDDFRNTLQELSLKYDVCLVVVDYFRLIQDIVESPTGAGRQEKVSRELMAIAREFDTHVLSIFDLNREGQKSKRPHLYHMKWGTGAHFDGDYIFIMWLDEDSCKRKAAGENLESVQLNLELAKARNAPLAQTRLILETCCGHFEPYYQREVE